MTLMFRANAQSDSTLPVPDAIRADCGLIANFMECFTRNQSCPFADLYYPETVNPKNGFNIRPREPDLSFSRAGRGPGFVSKKGFVMRRFLADVVALERNTSFVCDVFLRDAEKNLVPRGGCLEGFECVATACIKSLSRFHDAFSKGVEWRSGGWVVVDATTNIFTQSFFVERTRVFYGMSLLYEGVVFGVALLVTGVCAWVTLRFRKWLFVKFKND
jgi:hypothetical protein